MAFDRRLMVMFRPSSSRRTFSSRVPNKVSMLGLTPMLFFMRAFIPLGSGLGSCLMLVRISDSDSSRETVDRHLRLLDLRGLTNETKQGFAWRRDQPKCACPEGKSLPFSKAYPGAVRESMGAKCRSPVGNL